MKSLANLNDTLDGYELAVDNLRGVVGRIKDTLFEMPLDTSLVIRKGAGEAVYTRATTATYTDIYGVVQHAAIDEPRFEKEGLLMEIASTNLCLNSHCSSWSPIQGTVDSTTISAPDGSATAARFTGDGAATSVFGGSQGTITGRTNVNVYMSFWAKSDTETSANGGFFYTGGAGTVYGGTITYELTPEWKRYGYQITLGAHTDQPNVYPQPLRMSGWTGTIDFWGCQVEELPYASSYIPTTDAATTRSQDYCHITKGLENTAAGSGASTSQITVHVPYPDSSKDYFFFYRDTDNVFYLRSYLGIFKAIEGALNWEAVLPETECVIPKTIMTTYDKDIGVKKVYVNGESYYEAASGASTNTVSGEIIHLGLDIDHPIHIKNFKIWDFALTADEIKLL